MITATAGDNLLILAEPMAVKFIKYLKLKLAEVRLLVLAEELNAAISYG
jgi:hypothetical protein